MAIKQRCVSVSPYGGHGQDLVVSATKRSEVLANSIVSPQHLSPVRWVASDGWQLNLALVAAIAEAVVPPVFSHKTCYATRKPDVSHVVNGDMLCHKVCELLQLAVLKDFLFKVIKLLSARIVQRGCSCSVLSVLLCSCCSLFCSNSSSFMFSSSAHKAVKWLGRTELCLDNLAARAARDLDAGDSCCWPAVLLGLSVLAAVAEPGSSSISIQSSSDVCVFLLFLRKTSRLSCALSRGHSGNSAAKRISDACMVKLRS